MQITPNILTNTFVQNANRIQQEVLRLEEQASSGQKYQVPADNPSAVSATMDLNALGGQLGSYQDAATAAGAWLKNGSAALAQINTLWQDIYSKAVQSKNGTLSSTDLQAVQDQLSTDQQTLNQLLTTQYQGQPLFDYTSASPLAYQIGPNSTLEVNTLNPSGTAPASAVNLSQTLTQDLSTLISNLNNNQTSAINLTTLQNDQSLISNAQSLLGSRLNRVQQQQSYLNQVNLTISQSVQHVDGADMASVASQLTLEEQAYQAALQTGSKILPMTLLNYIQP